MLFIASFSLFILPHNGNKCQQEGTGQINRLLGNVDSSMDL